MRSLKPQERGLISGLPDTKAVLHPFLLVRLTNAEAKIILQKLDQDLLEWFGDRYVIFPGESLLIVHSDDATVAWEKVKPMPVEKVVPFPRPYDYSVLY